MRGAEPLTQMLIVGNYFLIVILIKIIEPSFSLLDKIKLTNSVECLGTIFSLPVTAAGPGVPTANMG